MKALTLVDAGENRGGLLLENSMADFVCCAFQERTYAVLGRFHVKLQSKNALTYCESLSLRNFTLGE